MMIGEFQIVEQLKEAYYFSRDKKMLGPILSRMIQKSLETGKYIRTNTEIGKGAVSVSYAAIEEITKRFDLSLSSFLCVGLGETSKLSIRHLHQKKISNIKIANRTDKKAVEFSKELNLDTIKFKNFKKEMESIDVAIFCTSSKKPIIKKDELIDISSRRDNELLILDLSVPRNIPISAYEVNDINVINIDNLKDTVNENYKKRRKEIGKAEKQIEEFKRLEKQIKEILTSTKTIALVGASSREDKDSFKVMQYLQNNGYKVIPINPFNLGKKILGENVYSSLEEVEINIDLVDIFRPSDETPNLAHQTVKIGAKTLWLQLGIFNTEAKKIVETAKINFIENKCTKKEFEKIINK